MRGDVNTSRHYSIDEAHALSLANRLIRVSYRKGIDQSHRAKIRNWCDAHVEGRCWVGTTVVLFELDSDAQLFRLTWL